MLCPTRPRLRVAIARRFQAAAEAVLAKQPHALRANTGTERRVLIPLALAQLTAPCTAAGGILWTRAATVLTRQCRIIKLLTVHCIRVLLLPPPGARHRLKVAHRVSIGMVPVA